MTTTSFTDPQEVFQMFPHPEDLRRMHHVEHAEMMKSRTLERRARQAGHRHGRTRPFHEISVRIRGFVASRRWWALFTGRNHRGGTSTVGTPSPVLTQLRSSVDARGH
jgi:hypothetical protein